ncbi:MAG: molybdate ABC transporter substrate-binding protein [Erysipelotrichaceae bacterium]|nr:molybdate ABC transporter substrate-binding protein [Erysipelotrichaceae bacterium]
MKKILIVLLCVCALLGGCVQKEQEETVTLTVAAAASLKNVMEEELIPLFVSENPTITIAGTYDSSGKLQAQIEGGLEADLFMSAATKQMNALVEEDYITQQDVTELLVNKIVLIVPKDSAYGLQTYEDIVKVSTVVLGDPESVPAGQYAKESLTNLGLWESLPQTSFATNVTEVLNQVAQGSADAGIVYATDAASMKDDVVVISEAPEGCLEKEVIYPAGVLKNTKYPQQAEAFMKFLQSDEARVIFEKYGFTVK